MGMEGYVNPNSPVYLLGLGAADATQEIWTLTVESPKSSSVWSGISSWLGLFGDLGLVGLSVFVWMSWILWRHLKGRRRWEVGAARAVLVMAGLLAAVYSWLEEPGFTLLVALIVAAGLIASMEEDPSAKNLVVHNS